MSEDDSKKRLGKSRQAVRDIRPLSKLHKFVLPSMSVALRQSQRQLFKVITDKDRSKLARVGNRPVDGDPLRLAQQMEQSDALVDEAIALDPRLARRANWVRRDEGEYCDSALLAQGDDAPFYKRTKSTVTDVSGSGEPVVVVISTDDRNIVANTASAFIATARIVQQFVPLEIWWQGAWLNEERDKGHIVFAPLCSGDMDFSRLEYCINDPTRDEFSFLCVTTHAIYNAGETNNGCHFRATCSYLPDKEDAKFVPHTGIKPTAESVAGQAARWLGWESSWRVGYELEQCAEAALQSLPVPSTPSKPYEYTAADRERYAREAAVRQQQAAAEARERMAAAEA